MWRRRRVYFLWNGWLLSHSLTECIQRKLMCKFSSFRKQLFPSKEDRQKHSIMFVTTENNYFVSVKKRNVCIRAKWPIRPELIPVSVAWSDKEYFYSPPPPGWDASPLQVTLNIKLFGTHSGGERLWLYVWNIIKDSILSLAVWLYFSNSLVIHHVKKKNKELQVWDGVWISAL